MNTPVVLSLQVTNLKLPGVVLECTLSNPLTSEILGNTKEGSRVQMLILPELERGISLALTTSVEF